MTNLPGRDSSVSGASQGSRDQFGTVAGPAPALNTIAATLVITGSLFGALATPRFEVTASLFGPAATLLSSDPRAFWMWWAITGGMAGFVVWHWLPGRRFSQRLIAIAWPALVAGCAYLAWVLAAHFGLVITSVALLVVAEVALCLVVWRFVKYPSPSPLEHLATDTGWGLALGFLTVQLLASVGVVIEAYELATGQLYEIAAIAAYIAFIAGALGLAGRLYRQFSVGLALLWGFGWMGWDRLMGEPRNVLLAALAGTGCFIILAGFYASGRRRRRDVQGLDGHPWQGIRVP